MAFCTYSPQISPGNDSLTPPPSVGPVLIRSPTITFTYPYDTPTTTLELRSPDVGDNESLTFYRISRETRGSSLNVYNDPTWPKVHVLSFTVTGLTQDEITGLQTFIKESLGKEVGYLDYQSIQWKGLIMNPDTVIKNNKRNCDFGAQFSFRGEVV